ncbi:hypothetical protein M3Y96_00441500 [Aphelenchoides besseyi]|nr:hypothetical protein M3Y96_00441500 [Aphelenchoides besseyi]
MKIEVVFWNWKNFMLEVKPTDTVEQVKKKIQKKGGPPADQQIATFCRMELKDDKMLMEYALRLAAAESADGREFIGKLGANGSLSSYVNLLELIADDYVRLQQTSSVDYQ